MLNKVLDQLALIVTDAVDTANTVEGSYKLMGHITLVVVAMYVFAFALAYTLIGPIPEVVYPTHTMEN